MRYSFWLAAGIGIGLGCAPKDPPALPDVSLDPNAPPVAAAPRDPHAGRVATIDFGLTWDPQRAAPADVTPHVKMVLGQKAFATHHNQHLAGATVGVMTSGWHGVASAAAMTVVYPEAAKRIDAKWKDQLIVAGTTGGRLVDVSTHGMGETSARMVVIRVSGGTDDDLRARFDQYLARLEPAVRSTGVTVTGHTRGESRPTGARSEIRYETPTLTGTVRSVIVRTYDPADRDLVALMQAHAKSESTRSLYRSFMTPEKGPFLVADVREERR